MSSFHRTFFISHRCGLLLSVCMFVGLCSFGPDLALADPPKKAAKVKPTKSSKSSKASKKDQINKNNKDKADAATAYTAALHSLIQTYEQKQYASALAYCEQAMRSMPDVIDVIDADERAGVMLLCKELYDKNNRPEDAYRMILDIQKLPLSESRKQSLCFSEATSLTRLHRYEEARLKYLSCPGKNDRARSMVSSNIAELYMIEGDCEKAVQNYRNALEYEPHNAYAFFGMASAFSRLEQWDRAHEAFISGIEADPSFSFLEDSFFEPAAENDYQKAYRFYELGRYREAIFYLRRYIDTEDRQTYRTKAQIFLNRIENSPAPLSASYPVLLETTPDTRCEALAIDSTGTRLAFAAGRTTGDDRHVEIWTMNTGSSDSGIPNDTPIVKKRLTLPPELTADMSFVQDSSTLRILTQTHRYQIDAASERGDCLIYENAPMTMSFGLSPSADRILASTLELSADNTRFLRSFHSSPWNNPYQKSALTGEALPMFQHLEVSADESQMLITAEQPSSRPATHLVELQHNRIIRTFPASFRVSAMAASPTAKIYALGIQTGVLLVDENGRILRMFGTQSPVSRLAFDPTGRKLAALEPLTVEIWNTDTD